MDKYSDLLERLHDSWTAIGDLDVPLMPDREGQEMLAEELGQAIAAIQELTAQPVVPEGWALVPKEMHLDENDLDCLRYHAGDGSTAEPYSEVVLWVGETQDTVGGEVTKSYGLNVMTAEYPEEGSTPIAEFKDPLKKN